MRILHLYFRQNKMLNSEYFVHYAINIVADVAERRNTAHREAPPQCNKHETLRAKCQDVEDVVTILISRPT